MHYSASCSCHRCPLSKPLDDQSALPVRWEPSNERASLFYLELTSQSWSAACFMRACAVPFFLFVCFWIIHEFGVDPWHARIAQQTQKVTVLWMWSRRCTEIVEICFLVSVNLNAPCHVHTVLLSWEDWVNSLQIWGSITFLLSVKLRFCLLCVMKQFYIFFPRCFTCSNM